MEKFMKNYVSLCLLLTVTSALFGQERHVKNSEPNSPPVWLKEARMAAESNYIESFADAFRDPNILIGVFERPLEVGELTHSTLSSGEVLEDFPGYREATRRYKLNKLRCIKALKGSPPEPVVFVPTFVYIFRSLYERPPVPPFVPLHGSRWVLALRKTSQEYRIERFGKGIEKYKFFNDRTVFNLFRGGHGALWPEKKEEPSYLVKVSESVVEDFNDIQQVIPIMLKEKTDPNDEAVLNETRNGLKTDPAKSIFEKLSADKPGKIQDANDQR